MKNLEMTNQENFKDLDFGGFYAVIYNELKNPGVDVSLLREVSNSKKKVIVVLLDLDHEEIKEKIIREGLSIENFIFIGYKSKGKNSYALENKGSLVEISHKMRELEDKFKAECSILISAEKLLLFNSSENIKRFFHYRREHTKQVRIISISSFADGETSSNLLPVVWDYFDKIIEIQ